MTQDKLKLVLEALKWCHGGEPCGTAEAIVVVEKALAQHDSVQAKPEPEQEPVAHCKVRPLRGDESFPKVEIDWVNQPVPGPLYTTPPQRTWAGLTKKEVATTDWSADFRAGALWAEAKLKDKNCVG